MGGWPTIIVLKFFWIKHRRASQYSDGASLWMAQDSRRHRLEVWVQVLITCASSHLMGCPVELECSVRAERPDLWCSFYPLG